MKIDKSGAPELMRILQSEGNAERLRVQQRESQSKAKIEFSCAGMDFAAESSISKRINVTAALERVEETSRPGEVPIVLHRSEGGAWIVVMDIRDWLKMARNMDSKGGGKPWQSER